MRAAESSAGEPLVQRSLDEALAALDHAWRDVHLQHMLLGCVLAIERGLIESLHQCRHRCTVGREAGPLARAELLASLSRAITAMQEREHSYRELQARFLAQFAGAPERSHHGAQEAVARHG